MKKPDLLITPSYIGNFKCIGGACEDSCCIGWDIELDRKTFKSYRKSGHPDLKPLFSEHVYRNRYCYSKDVDFGKIAIRDNRWCPFLDENKLCLIQGKLGEEALSNVCHTFPRHYNILNGVCELSLYMSCPEAVRLLLSSDEPIEFAESDFSVKRFIINSEIDTNGKSWRKSPLRDLQGIRMRSIKMVQDRSQPLRNRLVDLGLYMEKLTGQESLSGSVNGFSPEHLDLFIYTIESLGMMGEDESPVFSEYTEAVLEEFSGVSPGSFGKVFDAVLKPFIDENPHLLEHYLVNMLFQENFPFSPAEDPFDVYIMVVLRYSLILFYLAVMASRKGGITFEDVVSMIQIHSKIINHHKSFRYNILQEIKRRDFDSMEFISGAIL
ncbi:MAG: flagellin lysine-N-methylase [Spirochaetales bacterium]|nr:flagellin lysine-N-methylase [Spirochaetales bacterium]